MAVAVAECSLSTHPTLGPGFVDQQVTGGVKHPRIDHKGVTAAADVALAADISTSPDGLHAVCECFACAGRAIAVHRQSRCGEICLSAEIRLVAFDHVTNKDVLQAHFLLQCTALG
nr:hypothetical protein [Synechococcus sp. BIOS-E4-1]